MSYAYSGLIFLLFSLIVGTRRGKVLIYDTRHASIEPKRTMESVKAFSLQAGPINKVQWHPAGDTGLFSTSGIGVSIWDSSHLEEPVTKFVPPGAKFGAQNYTHHMNPRDPVLVAGKVLKSVEFRHRTPFIISLALAIRICI